MKPGPLWRQGTRRGGSKWLFLRCPHPTPAPLGGAWHGLPGSGRCGPAPHAHRHHLPHRVWPGQTEGTPGTQDRAAGLRAREAAGGPVGIAEP